MATAIDSKRIKELPRARTRDALIGELLVQEGVLQEKDVARVLTTQRDRNLRFGEAALKLGVVKEADLKRVLARQYDFPYVSPAKSSLSRSLAAAYEPFGAYAEALRGLRAQLLMRWFSDKRKTLAVVAAGKADGAAEVASNLAIAFAQLGERTLLLESNLREPRIHDLFGVTPKAGFASVLAGRASLPEALTRVEGFERLTLLCAGDSVPNPQELLSRVTFSYVMETIPASYDIVIVVAPPALENADALIVAARAGGSILVTRRHKTKLADVQLAKTQLEASGAPLLGALVVG